MADSIQQQITDNIIATMKKVRTTNGYGFNSIVEEANEEDNRVNRIRDGLVIVQPLDAEDLVGAIGHDTWLQAYQIDVYAFEEESSSVINASRAQHRSQDIIKELMTDRHRGTLAINTITPRLVLHKNKKGVSILFDVQYRTLLDDPFNQ